MTGELVATLTCGTDSDAAEEAKKESSSEEEVDMGGFGGDDY